MDAEKMMEKIMARLEAPDLPLSVALWDTEEIAIYMRRSINRVRSDIVSLPTFPRPIRLPVSGRSQALYKAREVIAWTESHTS